MHHGTCLRLPHLKLSLSIEGMAISSNPTLKSKAAEFAFLGMPELAGRAHFSETEQGALKNREAFHNLSEHFEVAFGMTWRVIANPEHCSKRMRSLTIGGMDFWNLGSSPHFMVSSAQICRGFWGSSCVKIRHSAWILGRSHVAAYIFYAARPCALQTLVTCQILKGKSSESRATYHSLSSRGYLKLLAFEVLHAVFSTVGHWEVLGPRCKHISNRVFSANL